MRILFSATWMDAETEAFGSCPASNAGVNLSDTLASTGAGGRQGDDLLVSSSCVRAARLYLRWFQSSAPVTKSATPGAPVAQLDRASLS
jgi:hypothetical protein